MAEMTGVGQRLCSSGSQARASAMAMTHGFHPDRLRNNRKQGHLQEPPTDWLGGGYGSHGSAQCPSPSPQAAHTLLLV
jgi:hypothetical protein